MAWLQSHSLWIQQFAEGLAVLQFDPPGKAIRMTRAILDELEAALIAVESRLNPPMPTEWHFWRRIWAYLQLATYPIVGLVFSVLPALESQTRLMLGRYLE